MHEVTSEHWHEPEGRKNAGYGAWKRPNTPYDDFMEAQGIPIFRGIGVKRVQDMPLKRWNRMGGNGTFTAYLFRAQGGTFTQLGTAVTFASGTNPLSGTLRLEAAGSSLKASCSDR